MGALDWPCGREGELLEEQASSERAVRNESSGRMQFEFSSQ